MIVNHQEAISERKEKALPEMNELRGEIQEKEPAVKEDVSPTNVRKERHVNQAVNAVVLPGEDSVRADPTDLLADHQEKEVVKEVVSPTTERKDQEEQALKIVLEEKAHVQEQHLTDRREQALKEKADQKVKAEEEVVTKAHLKSQEEQEKDLPKDLEAEQEVENEEDSQSDQVNEEAASRVDGEKGQAKAQAEHNAQDQLELVEAKDRTTDSEDQIQKDHTEALQNVSAADHEDQKEDLTMIVLKDRENLQLQDPKTRSRKAKV